MGNGNISQSSFFFKSSKRSHDLHLGMCVQRRHRFIKQNHFRLTGHCPGDADSLQLSSRQFMRKTAGIRFIQSHQFQQLSVSSWRSSLSRSFFPWQQVLPQSDLSPEILDLPMWYNPEIPHSPFLQIFSAGTGTIYRSPIHLHFTLIRFQKSTDYFS